MQDSGWRNADSSLTLTTNLKENPIDIQFSDTGVYYNINNNVQRIHENFKDASFNVKITDNNGQEWINSDVLNNGAGGTGYSAILSPENNLSILESQVNFPIGIEVQLFQSSDLTGPFTTINYSISSQSGLIADPNNIFTFLKAVNSTDTINLHEDQMFLLLVALMKQKTILFHYVMVRMTTLTLLKFKII